jgi:hypothetical protein
MNTELNNTMDIDKLACNELYFFGGEKGGVGKSFVCRTAIQYHLDYEIPFTPFEADRSNPDVSRIYQSSNCKLAVFSEGEKYEDAANAIYNAALKKRVLVNLPAQVLVPMRAWIEKNELFAIAEEDGIVFHHIFVSDGGYDSLSLFKRSLDYFGDFMPHVFVKNFGRCDDWAGFEEDDNLQQRIQECNVTVIEFPKFIGTADRNRIDAESLTFGKARELKKFGSISRQRVKSFLRSSYQAFEEAGVFRYDKS